MSRAGKTETHRGAGKVYLGEQFISDVEYELRITQTFMDSGVEGSSRVDLIIKPTETIGALIGLERYTLLLSDGRKQLFYVRTSFGECRATGGPQ
jgi:hypothetical protein